jgi:hypothetical protein
MSTTTKQAILPVFLLIACLILGSVFVFAQDKEESTLPAESVIDENIVILRKYEIESKRVTVYYDKKTRTICHITDAGHISCLPYQPQLWPTNAKNYIREMLQKNKQEKKEIKEEKESGKTE